MHRKTIKELQHALSTKEISAYELTSYFLNRIEKYDPQLNSFITTTAEQALEKAKKIDAQSSGDSSGLKGIPIAQKDIFCTQGIRTTCGSKMLDQFYAPYDATVVTKLNEAGSIMLGKTNMDEFAMGSSNENSYYGPVKNPWNLQTVAGGSSGGSAAAVAAGLVPGATGTDTGGSIREPAALCGITGLKPTYGRISRYGIIAYASSLDQAGPFAKTAEDCAILLNSMAGFDEKDSTSADQPVPDYTATLNDALQNLKIGLPKEFFKEGLNPDIAAKIEDALKIYEKLGAKLVEISLPTTHYSVPTYYIIAPAECSSNLARYDGIRYGHRCQNPKNLDDLYKRSRAEGFGIEVKRRIMVGTYALSAGYFDAYYVKAQKVRRLIAQDFEKAFNKVDVIMGPTSPSTAFKIGEKVNNPLSMYLSDIYTIAINLAGLPAISIPVGFSQNLPVGLQIIGKHFNEAKLLNVAHQYQTQTDWHQKQSENYQ